MITSLTKEQHELMTVYRDKWINIGLSTNTDHTKSEELIKDVYAAGKLPPPKKVIWFKSPIELLKWYAQNEDVSLNTAWGKCNFCFGSHDASWLSFYDYFIGVFDMEKVKLINPLIELSKVCGWFAPFENICLMSDKPEVCKTEVNARGHHQLHSDEGPAVAYADEFSIYALHGTVVPEHIVTTPADKLDVKFLDTEKNADVRRVFIQKVGIKNVIDRLNPKILNTEGSYALLKTTNPDRTYLKMQDASTGEWYVEAVPPTIETVKQALAWRDEEETFQEPVVRT